MAASPATPAPAGSPASTGRSPTSRISSSSSSAPMTRCAAATRANLDAMLQRLRAAGVPVLLAGMRAPPNLGRDYAAAFDRIYPALAAKYGVALYPFFLDGVAIDPRL